jgi:AcrR family transcriptional regulator
MDINAEFEIILNKVAGLYQKYGIKSVTMDDIARELGISKKTIYNYVCDKDDLVKQVSEFIDRKKDEKLFQHLRDTDNAIEELLEVNVSLNRFIE